MTVPLPPPPARNRTLRWGLVLGVAAVVVAVVALRSPGPAPPGRLAGESPGPPSPTAAPEPTGTGTAPAEPTSPPDASATDPVPGDALAPLPGPPPEGIEEVVEQVAALRGMPAGEPLDARVVPAGELGSRFAELAFAEYEEGDLELDGRLLAALRLLGEGDDLRAAIEELYRAQVIGLYVVEDQVLYIAGDDSALTPAQHLTAAHEVQHGLQDRAFDLEGFMDIGDADPDGQLARLALVEGDAMLTQELWSVRYQSPAERREAAAEALSRSPSALLAAPAYLRESLLFPYRDGLEFVRALYASGGFAAVDAAFAAPPAGTRHVLRPETYLTGQTHTGAEVTTDPGPGWQHASTYTFGEFDVDQWLEELGEARLDVTAGWDGAETRHWHRGEEDAVALALRLASPAAAEAACTAAGRWYETVADGAESGSGLYRGDRDWMALACGDAEVVVGLAPDAATARRLAGHEASGAATTGARHYTGPAGTREERRWNAGSSESRWSTASHAPSGGSAGCHPTRWPATCSAGS